VFPAGRSVGAELEDATDRGPHWSPAIARIARRAGAPVLPVYVPGRNRAMFQTAGLIHPRLRTALLPREFLARWGKPIELRIGTAVSCRALAHSATMPMQSPT
jgi:putative hemolysin